MTLGELLALGERELTEAQVPEAALNAWYLLQACMGAPEADFSRGHFFLHREEEADGEVERHYQRLLDKRKERVPLEYITGYTEFMGLPFWVDEHVLIPRQDTETLVEYMYPLCQDKSVLDLCTGSGCIGLSIGVLGNPKHLVLSDVSPRALQMAKKNLTYLQKTTQGRMRAEVELVCGDLFENVKGVFDVIVSNPPYIEDEKILELMPEVQRFEPRQALAGGEDGLRFYRQIIAQSRNYLMSDGILCFEIGYNQGESVSAMMIEQGFEQVQVRQDLAGNDRVVCGQWIK